MAGVNDGLFGKSQNLFADAGKEQVTISSGKIPTTHAIGKQYVSTVQLTKFG